MNLKLYCSEYKYRRYFLIAAEDEKKAEMFIEDQESDEYGCEYLESFIFEKKVTEVQDFPIEEIEYEVEQFNEWWEEKKQKMNITEAFKQSRDAVEWLFDEVK